MVAADHSQTALCDQLTGDAKHSQSHGSGSEYGVLAMLLLLGHSLAVFLMLVIAISAYGRSLS
ncbi:hypothetical protein [Halomicronema sp. CCY15110]|uniref:hypothetical protein n=1 Tax=Halomicronema sp. CCY15110 TaxID=2767773 RepID=UPI0019515D65|nr:hypothetical protein [Halomicronema sp. CCY15110]